jgi:hypothetical protein
MTAGRHQRWLEAVAAPAAPYEWFLGLAPGACLPAAPPWPDLEVLTCEEVHVRRLVWQTARVRASAADEGAEACELTVGRLVAELEDDNEVEVQRFVVPADVAVAPAVDTAVCAACGGGIIAGEAVVSDVAAYHRHCLEG